MKKIILFLFVFCSFYQIQAINIAIISLYDQKYKEIGKHHDRNVIDYAIKHNYDYIAYHRILDESRPASWSKIKALEKHLDEYDWLAWIDADALIANFDIPLESLIDDNYDLIISTSPHWGKDILACGNFLLRNTIWSRWLLNRLYRMEEFIDNPNDPYWEQSALNHLFKTDRSIRSHIKTHPQSFLNSYYYTYKPGDFLIHFAAGSFAWKSQEIQKWFNYIHHGHPQPIHSHPQPIKDVTKQRVGGQRKNIRKSRAGGRRMNSRNGRYRRRR